MRTDIELRVSNTIDVVSVDNTHKVINNQTSMNQVLIKTPSGLIEPEQLEIDHHATQGILHSISKEDGKVILSILFKDGSYVLKNAQVFVTAKGIYENEEYSVTKSIRYIAVVKEEQCTLKPKVDAIYTDYTLQFNPAYVEVNILRTFDGLSTEFAEYKNYQIRYSYSTNLDYEYDYIPNQYISLANDIQDAHKCPDFIALNLYKHPDDNIPVHSVNLKIIREAYTEVKKFQLVSENTLDEVITDADYVVVTDTTIRTYLKYQDSNRYAKILNNSIYPVDIELSTLFDEDEELLSNIEFATESQEDGTLLIELIYKKGVLIPKRMSMNISAYGQYMNNPNILFDTCKFTVNGNPSATAIYGIQPNANAIRVNKDEIRDPLIIGVDKYKWLGNTRENTDYGFVLYTLDAGEPLLYDRPIDVDDVENNVLFEYYAPDLTLLAREEIYVVYDGIDAVSDPGYDELASYHKYYFAWDHSDTEGYVPSYAEDWVSDKYPSSKLYNKDKPYLWSYEVTTYKNTITGHIRTIRTTPVIVAQYVEGLSKIEEYYYAVARADMNKTIGYKQVDNSYIVKFGEEDTPYKWSMNTDKDSAISPDRPMLYKIVVTTESSSSSSVVNGPYLISNISTSVICWNDLDAMVVSEIETPEEQPLNTP